MFGEAPHVLWVITDIATDSPKVCFVPIADIVCEWTRPSLRISHGTKPEMTRPNPLPWLPRIARYSGAKGGAQDQPPFMPLLPIARRCLDLQQTSRSDCWQARVDGQARTSPLVHSHIAIIRKDHRRCGLKHRPANACVPSSSCVDRKIPCQLLRSACRFVEASLHLHRCYTPARGKFPFALGKLVSEPARVGSASHSMFTTDSSPCPSIEEPGPSGWRQSAL